MLTIALTGGIGCGKTTVCELFSAHGVPIIDTDTLARELVQPGQQALQEITNCFGKDILFANGTLDRQKLAGKIFSSQSDKASLETILHPRIRQRVKEQLDSLTSDYAIIAIPLLVETSQQSQYDRVLLVDCTEQQQITRTQARDHRSTREIKAIIKSQATRQQRISVADDIIENNAGICDLELQVKQLHNQYLSLA
ncbi:MAG TPA: dephospho-CoA kinase [Gammaproteobacteria bacterium]|nr:dephospho-CoA kinase [Gammaproteobacteria bacterium]